MNIREEQILAAAEHHGLEINASRFCGNTTAYLLGCGEVLQGWESLSELLTWAWHKTDNDAFLDLSDEAEELETD